MDLLWTPQHVFEKIDECGWSAVEGATMFVPRMIPLTEMPEVNESNSEADQSRWTHIVLQFLCYLLCCLLTPGIGEASCREGGGELNDSVP